jgi:hypothetical protein
MWSEVISIEEVGEMDMIDIEVSDNHLFYANDILTHNSNSDVGLEDTSESFGLPATADFMFAIISNDELRSVNQIMVKQLKNRYSDIGINSKFVVGVDRSKMRLYDVEDSAQTLSDDSPVMDNTKFGEEDNGRLKSSFKFDRTKLASFK